MLPLVSLKEVCCQDRLIFRQGPDDYMFGILISALRRRWLLLKPPTIQEWIDIVHYIYVIERITFSLFTKSWTKWVKYGMPLRLDLKKKNFLV